MENEVIEDLASKKGSAFYIQILNLCQVNLYERYESESGVFFGILDVICSKPFVEKELSFNHYIYICSTVKDLLLYFILDNFPGFSKT